MKTQINKLIRGNSSRVGSAFQIRNEIASKVIAENPESLRIKIRNFELILKANWSLSRKSVSYSSSIPVELYESFFSNFAIPKNNPSAIIMINGDMTANFQTNSKKPIWQWVDESEIEIL